MLLLEWKIIRKKQVYENNAIELDAYKNDSEKYKIEAIYNSVVYTKKLKLDHLPELYYLVFWKSYL